MGRSWAPRPTSDTTRPSKTYFKKAMDAIRTSKPFLSCVNYSERMRILNVLIDPKLEYLYRFCQMPGDIQIKYDEALAVLLFLNMFFYAKGIDHRVDQ